MKFTGKMTLVAALASMTAGSAMAEAPKGFKDFEPITRAEALEKAAERFDAADADGDGVLSAQEAREAAHGMRDKLRGHKGPQMMDGPGHRDGARGMSEGMERPAPDFKEGRPELKRERRDFQPITREEALERAAERFDAADADGDGTLTRDEMGKASGKMRDKIRERMKERRGGDDRRGGPRPDRAAIFEKIDADGDGVITAEEFEAAKKARPEHAPERNPERAPGRP